MDARQDFYLAALAQCPGLGSRRLGQLLQTGLDAVSLWQMPALEMSRLVKMPQGLVSTIDAFRRDHPDMPEALADICEQRGVHLCTMQDEDYPYLLKEIFSPPPVLYCRGTLMSKERRVAIVGSRRLSPYGEALALEFGEQLAAAGLTVVSGAARGVDTRSHRGALKTGRTVAVLGFVVVDMLEEYFKDIVDVKFTANLENELDEIAEGKVHKNQLLREFYGPFEQTLEKADEAIGHVELPVEVSDVRCEHCGRLMVIKQGRYGKVLACPGFPECRNTKPLLKDTGVKCPKCGGKIVERRTRRGRTFYGCENYPDCDYTTWDTPQQQKCEKCGAFLLKHHFKNGRGMLYCSNDACETRINHPINKELEKMRERAEAKRKREEEKMAAEAEKKENP